MVWNSPAGSAKCEPIHGIPFGLYEFYFWYSGTTQKVNKYILRFTIKPWITLAPQKSIKTLFLQIHKL